MKTNHESPHSFPLYTSATQPALHAQGSCMPRRAAMVTTGLPRPPQFYVGETDVGPTHPLAGSERLEMLCRFKKILKREDFLKERRHFANLVIQAIGV